MNKEQIIDEAYENYLINFIRPICPPNLDVQPSYYEPMTKEWFIKSIKERSLRGNEFSEKWGLKIEERELDMSERWELANLTPNMSEIDYCNKLCDEHNVPTKLITITYKDTIIESYE
jgi:hypothetical protein